MGERYLVTGVQLGMLIASSTEDGRKLIRQITNKQFIGHSNGTIEEDVEKTNPKPCIKIKKVDHSKMNKETKAANKRIQKGCNNLRGKR